MLVQGPNVFNTWIFWYLTLELRFQILIWMCLGFWKTTCVPFAWNIPKESQASLAYFIRISTWMSWPSCFHQQPSLVPSPFYPLPGLLFFIAVATSNADIFFLGTLCPHVNCKLHEGILHPSHSEKRQRCNRYSICIWINEWLFYMKKNTLEEQEQK